MWKFFRLHRNSACSKGDVLHQILEQFVMIQQTRSNFSRDSHKQMKFSISNSGFDPIVHSSSTSQAKSAVNCKMNKKWIKCNLLTIAESTSAIFSIACQFLLLKYLIPLNILVNGEEMMDDSIISEAIIQSNGVIFWIILKSRAFGIMRIPGYDWWAACSYADSVDCGSQQELWISSVNTC
jgi:hypothetical protein